MANRAISFWIIVAVAVVAFAAGMAVQRRVTETQMSEARERSMRVELCNTICRTRGEGMLGIAEHPEEWRCFCETGHMQPLP